MSWDSIVLIKSWLFLIFVAGDDFKIIRSENFFVDFLDAVNKFDWGSIAIFREERYGYISSFDGFQDVVYRFIYEQCILNFVLWLLSTFSVKSFHDLWIVWLCALCFWRLLVFLLGFASLIETGYFGSCERFDDVCRRKVLWMCKRQIVILELFFDIKLVELIIDGVIWLFGDWEEGIIWLFESLLLFLLKLQKFFELNTVWNTSNLSDLSALSFLIAGKLYIYSNWNDQEHLI